MHKTVFKANGRDPKAARKAILHSRDTAIRLLNSFRGEHKDIPKKHKFYWRDEMTPVGRHAIPGQTEQDPALALFHAHKDKKGERKIYSVALKRLCRLDTSKDYRGRIGLKTQQRMDAHAQ